MKTIEYRFIDKKDWGEGPWQQEPDKVQWLDEATGLPCLIVRNHHGALCGYVGVSEGHPYFEKDWTTTDFDVDVHWGVNFSHFCSGHHKHGICHVVEPGESDRVWWIGFDCGHAFDVSPAMAAHLRTLKQQLPDSYPNFLKVVDLPVLPFETYREVEYVKDECRRLAEQLKAICVPA